MKRLICLSVAAALMACSGESTPTPEADSTTPGTETRERTSPDAEGRVPERDVTSVEVEVDVPEGDTGPNVADTSASEEDVAEDASLPMADASSSLPDIVTPDEDTESPVGDASPPQEDLGPSEEDTSPSDADASAPPLNDTDLPQADAGAPVEDSELPQEDASAPTGDVEQPLDDVEESDASEGADATGEDAGLGEDVQDTEETLGDEPLFDASACLKSQAQLGTEACDTALEVDLGVLAIGESASVDVSVHNTGEAWASLSSLTPSSAILIGEIVDGEEVIEAPADLPVGASLTVRATLSPELPGALNETLSITLQGPEDESLVFVLSIAAQVALCSEGLADCDGDAQNGCEAELMSSAAHCGACDSPCIAVHGQATCVEGVCLLTCDAGWEGVTCDEDIDECLEGPCGENAACTNTSGSYTCACLEGFEGDGLVCDEVLLGGLTMSLSVEISVPDACVMGEVSAEAPGGDLDLIMLSADAGEFFSDASCMTPLDATYTGGAFWLRPSAPGLLQVHAAAKGYSGATRDLLVHGEHFATDERNEGALVLYNLNQPDALGVAQYYATSRGIDEEQLCPVSLPRGIYASPEELLGARTQIVEDCFCPLLGDGAPTPCDVSTLPEVLASLPITHLVMIRGLPARLYGTPWSTDNENPSFDFYLSVLLARDLPLFEAGTSGAHTLDYPYVSSALTYSPALNPAEHGYFAIARVEAITAERTLGLIDRTLTSEAHGFEGNILSESKTSFTTRSPGRALTSSYDPACTDYLSHEPFVFGAEESSWPYELCRWGSTGSTSEGSASQLMPGMTNTTIPLAINVGFFNGGEPFSEPFDNNHSAFYNYGNMLRWRKSDAECTAECANLQGEEEILACEESSTDYFKVLNTECVGVAPGFMGQQIRSYPVGYYGFLPPGWFGPSGGAGDKTPGTIRSDGAYNDETHTDPNYLRIGGAGLDAPNEDMCQLAEGEMTPCPERVAVGLRRSEDISPALTVTGERVILIRVRYRNQGHPGASLQLQLYPNKTSSALREADGALPSIPLNEDNATWQTAEFEVIASEEDYAEITHLSLQLNGNLNRKIHGFVDLDALAIVDLASGEPLMNEEALSFAWVRDRSTGLGESAADVIDRMNGIAYWGSSSHHLTGGWSFYSYDVARLIFQARTLGEATSYSGAKAGLVFGDPLYRGYGVSIYSDNRYALDMTTPRPLWDNTPESKLPRMRVLNGTDHALSLLWRVDLCTEGDKITCAQSDAWTLLMRGQGAIRNLPLDTAQIYQVAGDQPVIVRLRAWRPGDEAQHLSAYANLQVMGVVYEIPEGCAYDLDGNGSVSASDAALARPYRICTPESLTYDVNGDGKLDADDWLYALSNPEEVNLDVYDFNGDGVFDVADLEGLISTISLLVCGTTLEDGSFPEAYDVNDDEVIDDDDIALIVEADGTTGCSCESVTCYP